MLGFQNEQKKAEQIVYSNGGCYSKVSPAPFEFHMVMYLTWLII